jgi:hypothetical protein
MVAVVGCATAIGGSPAATGQIGTDTVTVLSATSGDHVTLQPSHATTRTSRGSVSPLFSAPSSSRVTVTETVPLPYALPDGFGWVEPDRGLAARQLGYDEFECRQGQPFCFGIEVFTGEGCPGGATVTMSIHAASDNAEIGEASDTTAPLRPGGRGKAIIGYEDYGLAITADLESIDCAQS